MKSRSLKIIVVTCLMLLAAQSSAWAHAFLDHAEPKVGSDNDKAPMKVKIWFTEAIEPEFSAIEVADADGKKVDKKDSHVDDADKTLLIVSLTDKLPPGTYSVTWHVVSTDTHKTHGTFKFTVK